MRNGDRIGGLIILVFGAGYLLGAISMPSATIGDPLGHKAFPIVLGGLMILLGLAIFIKPEKDLESSPLKKTFVSVLILAGLLGGYGYSIQSLGYPLGTFLFLFITSRLIGERSWIFGLLLSAVLSLGIFSLFTKILDIPLPLGIIQRVIG